MDEHDSHRSVSHRPDRLRFELIFGSIWLAVGLFLVPAVIFWVGVVLLGPYGEGQGGGLGTFYGDFFGDLANGEVRAWVLALGPLIVMNLIRLVFIGVKKRPPSVPPEPEEPAHEPAPAERRDGRRVEPRIGSD